MLLVNLLAIRYPTRILESIDDKRTCNACWNDKNIPDQWRIATVVLLYKKGDESLPSDYRPISLLPIGYKVLARMMQKRIQIGGVETRIRNTQFGFRPGRSTIQALSMVRRMIDAAYASKTPGLIAVMLDWAKAFDRIRVDSMMAALRRFGLPIPMLEMIAAIYKTIVFHVTRQRR